MSLLTVKTQSSTEFTNNKPINILCSRYKGVREIFDNNKFEIRVEGDKHILIVKDVYGEDADEYSIRATNKGGSRVSRAELEIKCKFSFKLHIQKIT